MRLTTIPNPSPEAFLSLYAATEAALSEQPTLEDLAAVITAVEESDQSAALLRVLSYPAALGELLEDLYHLAQDLGDLHREGAAGGAVWMSAELAKLQAAPPSTKAADVLGEDADIEGLIMLARARVSRGEGGPELAELLGRLEAEAAPTVDRHHA